MTVPAHSVADDSVQHESVSSDPDLAPTAALIADPTRATMLRALLAGRRWPPGNWPGWPG